MSLVMTPDMPTTHPQYEGTPIARMKEQNNVELTPLQKLLLQFPSTITNGNEKILNIKDSNKGFFYLYHLTRLYQESGFSVPEVNCFFLLSDDEKEKESQGDFQGILGVFTGIAEAKLKHSRAIKKPWLFCQISPEGLSLYQLYAQKTLFIPISLLTRSENPLLWANSLKEQVITQNWHDFTHAEQVMAKNQQADLIVQNTTDIANDNGYMLIDTTEEMIADQINWYEGITGEERHKPKNMGIPANLASQQAEDAITKGGKTLIFVSATQVIPGQDLLGGKQLKYIDITKFNRINFEAYKAGVQELQGKERGKLQYIPSGLDLRRVDNSDFFLAANGMPREFLTAFNPLFRQPVPTDFQVRTSSTTVRVVHIRDLDAQRFIFNGKTYE